MKKLLITITIILASAAFNLAVSQNYKTAVGARAGYPFGFTVKHMFAPGPSMEGIIGTRGRSIEGVVLYEHHVYPAKRKEFAIYFGGGGHLGAYDFNNRPYWTENDYRDDLYFGLGLDGIMGASWTFSEIPLNLGLDWKPAFSIIGYRGFLYGDAAISIRYTIK